MTASPLPAPEAPERDLLADITELREAIGSKTYAEGRVWQAMRDEWAALVRRWKAAYGPPVAILGGTPITMPPYWPGPLIA